MNPNITCNIVQNNPDKPWDWVRLTQNSNILYSEEDIFRFYLQHKLAQFLQQTFREANYNPSFLLCRRRLFHEYDEMNVKRKTFLKNHLKK